MEYGTYAFPEQLISNRKKDKNWRKRHLDWVTDINSDLLDAIRHTFHHKRINEDLMLGKLHMDDLQMILNPDGILAGYIPDNIQHYPLINAKINLLLGEEIKRPFNYRVTITNPTSITSIETLKRDAIVLSLQLWVQNTAQDELQAQNELNNIARYYKFEYQDIREKRANEYLNHFSREQDFKTLYNNGFYNGLVDAEEIYMCDIVSGQPILEVLNPNEIKTYMSGWSSKIEDADVIVITQYWSPGQIYDRYFSTREKGFDKMLKRLENYQKYLDEEELDSERDRITDFIHMNHIVNSDDDFEYDPFNRYGENLDCTEPVDSYGNIRVIRMFWKSRRKIKEIKKYDPQTGVEMYEFYEDSYQPNYDEGEEESIFWINEAWEGTKIGKDIYVNMGPRPWQYTTASNPSKCHFGIIGSIYTFNGRRPYSLVDMMKPYNYFYDVIKDRLNKAIASDWGSMLRFDFAYKPKGWDVDKWMYYAKINHMLVVDSYNVGQEGAARGVLAGGLNNNAQQMVSSSTGPYIQQLLNILEYCKSEIGEVIGITKQREGQVSNRETVGGVERSTLQSSHITEWVFTIHEALKKRVMECFLETAKIAARMRNDKTIKFQYISSDLTQQIMEIDADEFCENDYGLIVDNESSVVENNQKLEMLVQAALLNQMINFSTAMNIFQTCSFQEKINMIRQAEDEAMQRQQLMQQQQQQMQQLQLEMLQQLIQMKFDHENQLNERDNETKILIAEINNRNNDNVDQISMDKESLLEKMRLFDEKMKLDLDKFMHQKNLDEMKLQFDKDKSEKELLLKQKLINQKSNK